NATTPPEGNKPDQQNYQFEDQRQSYFQPPVLLFEMTAFEAVIHTLGQYSTVINTLLKKQLN
ncbi:unnamed protein product, partial [Timema podura]|nr:unnamed protein product [Timema podura]